MSHTYYTTKEVAAKLNIKVEDVAALCRFAGVRRINRTYLITNKYMKLFEKWRKEAGYKLKTL